MPSLSHYTSNPSAGPVDPTFQTDSRSGHCLPSPRLLSYLSYCYLLPGYGNNLYFHSYPLTQSVFHIVTRTNTYICFITFTALKNPWKKIKTHYLGLMFLWVGSDSLTGSFYSSHTFVCLFFGTGSHSVNQAGVWWRDHSSLQPQPLGLYDPPVSSF